MSGLHNIFSLSVALGDAASPWLQQGNLRACVRTRTHTHTDTHSITWSESDKSVSMKKQYEYKQKVVY